MNVLLTGATGFIGAQVLERLMARGDAVRVLVQPATLSRAEKVRHLQQREHVEIVAGRLADTKALAKAVEGVEAVYHLAWRSPPTVGRQGLSLMGTQGPENVRGTEHLLRASAAAGVRRFVFTSSVAVYGWDQSPLSWPLTEEFPLQAHGNYGKTKIAAENLIHRYHHTHGLAYLILRLCLVYGPGELFKRFVSRTLDHPLLFLSHDRGRISQWIHVRDAAAAVVLAGGQPEVVNHTLNIAGAEAVTRCDLVAMIYSAAGYNFRARQLRVRFHPWYNSRLMYDVSKAQRLLEFVPQVKLQQGIAEVITELDHRPMASHRMAFRRGWPHQTER
jgi:nucleoside-diphosphate-sugar epimerase